VSSLAVTNGGGYEKETRAQWDKTAQMRVEGIKQGDKNGAREGDKL